MNIEKEHEEKDDHGHGESRVHITIDGNCVEIRPGVHTVADVKRLGHVPDAYVLVQDLQGRLIPLADDGRVEIKGCEIFESHPRDGGSS